MTKSLPGNLGEIFPLRLRLRTPFRFFRSGDQFVAERIEDEQRFSLRPWQYEMIRRFDGQRTFEETSREVYQSMGGGFTAVGLLNFYRWLYQEDLVLCQCDSIFELVPDDEEEETVEQKPTVTTAPTNIARPKFRSSSPAEGGRPQKRWQRRTMGVAVIALFSLSLIRLAYVAAPIFEPPVNRLYAEVEEFFYEGVGRSDQSETARDVPESPLRGVELAGRVEPEDIPPPVEPVEVAPPIERTPEPSVDLEYIEELRRKMSECRIRRDEFYIQNDEEGYRREVEKMTALAREIGEVEASL